jgi:HD-like signal output (HDOD) protein
MKNWFARFIGKSKPQQQIRISVQEPVAVPSLPAKKSWQPPIKIDGPYYQWLVNREVKEKSVALDVERKLLTALRATLESDLRENRLIPRMPIVVPQLLKCLRDANVSMSKFSDELERDSLLLGEVIRQANNARFEGKSQISSIEQAVILVGEDGLRQLIATATMQPIINIQTGHYTKVAAARIWAHAQNSAILCRSLAGKYSVEPFEAYLAGLLHDIGLITALRIMDKATDGIEAPHSSGFCNAYANCAKQLSVRISELWELPPALIQAFNEQLAGENMTRSPLGDVLFTADQLSKARVMANYGHVKDETDSLMRGFDPETTMQYRQMQTHLQ